MNMVITYTIRFNIKKLYILLTESIYVFYMDLRKTVDFCPSKYLLVAFTNKMENVYHVVRTGSSNGTDYKSFIKG